MAETDADSQLLDRIGGKYGDGSDYEDFGNADEDALLDDNIFNDIEESHPRSKYAEVSIESSNELDETDVLDLEAQDVELEDDLEDKHNINVNNLLTVSSTTHSDINLDISKSSDIEEYSRGTDKFKNERESVVKCGNIPKTLDEIAVTQLKNNNRKRQGGFQRNRGRRQVVGNQYIGQQKQRSDNKTVLINPHFKGQVKINNDARLAWDARHKLNQRHQNHIGKVQPFLHNEKPIEHPIQPWSIPHNNVPFQQQPMQQPMYPTFQPPPQQAAPSIMPQNQSWNSYPNNNFNQVTPHQMPISNQNVFMQPLPPPPQTIYSNQPPSQLHYAPPVQQYPMSPMFPNQNMNPVYNNNQYLQLPPSNHWSPPSSDPYIPNFTPNQPPPTFDPPPSNQYNHPPPSSLVMNQPNSNDLYDGSSQLNQRPPRYIPHNQMNNFKPQPKFNNKQSPPKRKVDALNDLRKKKRVVQSTNLHEVQTVETPDTTVKEEKPDDEDEETKIYRRKIEEQKRIREKILAEKEKRRQEAVLKSNGNASKPPLVDAVLGNKTQSPQQCNRINLRNDQRSNDYAPNIVHDIGKKTYPRPNSNIKVIKTDSDESSYDKQHIASFLSNRKIIAKDQSLVDTSIVVVSNLAAGTTDVKLRKMCQGIGEIKTLQMSPKERQATIQFNSVASAHEFFKKFQRSMLDLSMIQVALKPMP